MHRGYTKLFNTIVTSTIWQEDDKTRIIWITMLAIADPTGVVWSSLPGLAYVAKVSVEAAEAALAKLSAPDVDSRTTDFEGRRIEKVDGGWLVLNYEKYSRMLSQEERKEYKARWIAEKRRRDKSVDKSRQKSTTVGSVDKMSAMPSEYMSMSLSLLKEGVRGRFEEWIKFRKGLGSKPKDWDILFSKQAEWLRQFNESDQIEILDQSMRNGWKGLFVPRRNNCQKPATTPALIPSWQDRKAQKQMIEETQEQKNELYRKKQRENREFTPEEQARYKELSSRLERLKSV